MDSPRWFWKNNPRLGLSSSLCIMIEYLDKVKNLLRGLAQKDC